jgi:hypothetical protein
MGWHNKSFVFFCDSENSGDDIHEASEMMPKDKVINKHENGQWWRDQIVKASWVTT